MDFQTLFYITGSISAVLISIFFLSLVILIFKSLKAVNEIKESVNDAIEMGIEYVEAARSSVSKTAETIVDFLVMKIIGPFIKKRKKEAR